MRTWDEVVKEALNVYNHRDEYAYFYGAKGQVLTNEVMDSLISAEKEFFSRYTSAQIRAFKDYSRGKVGLDCSGYVAKCTGVNTWSGGLIEACHDVTTNVYDGVAGSCLYLPGHVGIDIGYGYGLDFPRMGSTCELFRFKEGTRAWTKSGKLNAIDYTGADAR